MSRPPGDPLTRITINLLSSDMDVLRRRLPEGYQIFIRRLVHVAVMEMEGDETNQALEDMFP